MLYSVDALLAPVLAFGCVLGVQHPVDIIKSGIQVAL